MFVVMIAIIVSEEVALTEVVAALQRERLEASCLHFSARLEASLDRSAVHLERMEAAVARQGDTPTELPATDPDDLIVLRDSERGVLLSRPPGSATDALARYAEQPQDDGLVVLSDALYTVAVRPLGDGGRTLALAHPVADNIAAVAGKGGGIFALLSDRAVLALQVPAPELEGPAREALAHFLALRPLPPLESASITRDYPLHVLNVSGREWLALTEVLPGTDPPVAWIAYLRPRDEVLAPVLAQKTRLIGFGAGAVFCVLVVAALMAGRITRPIESLAGSMRLVSKGDLEQSVEVRGRDEVAQLSASFNEMTTGLRQKELLKRYVPMQARELIDSDASARVVLGGQRTQISVLFSDLRGFTTLSEKIDAEEVVSLLNEYLEAMLEAIHAFHGDVSDYIGDAILAVFHDTDEPGAWLAVQAAMRMQDNLDSLRQRTGNPHLATLRMGIGINTGPAVEGNIGTEDRLKYAVIGDTVNVGSRIQDRSKDGKHSGVLLSQRTYDEVATRVEAVFMEDALLKGKTTTVPIWEIVGLKP